MSEATKVTREHISSNLSVLEKSVNKGRTPSGTELSNNFGHLRTIFSPEAVKISELSENKITEPLNTSETLVKEKHAQHVQPPPQLNEQQTTQSGNQYIKAIAIAKAQRIKNKQQKKRQLSASAKSTQAENSIHPLSDCEGDNYFTPPATPIRKKRIISSMATSKPITDYLSPTAKETTLDENRQQEEQDMETQEKPTENITALSLETVMAMFHQLEQRMTNVEAGKETHPVQNEQLEQLKELKTSEILKVSQMQSQIDKCLGEIKDLRKENFILDRAARRSNMLINDLVERLEKLEMNNYRKMITISGLYIYGENKADRV